MRFVALLATVFLMMGSAWALAQDKPEPPPGQPSGPPPNAGDFPEEGFGRGDRIPLRMVFRLPNLSEDQLSRICSEVYEIQAKAYKLKAELAGIKLKLLCLQRRDPDTVDAGEIKKLFAESGRLEGESFLLRQQYMKTMKAILTTEQYKMLEPRRPIRVRRPRTPAQ